MYYSASALTFNTQSQVNAWGAANPNPTQIFDNVTITTTSSTDPIVDLSPLNSITYISLDLYINTNFALTSISSFNNLTGLRKLEIKFNNALTSIGGFNLLSSVTTDISIQHNNNCTEVSGFVSLSTMTGDLYVVSSGNVSGFTSLVSAGSLYLGKSDVGIGQQVNNISGLSQITTLNNLQINHSNLTNLDNFSNLNTCPNLALRQNYQLTNINGFQNISALYSLYFLANNLVTTLDPLDGVSFSSPFNCTIQSNTALTDISFLSPVTNASNFVIYANNALSNLDGIQNVTSAGYFRIKENNNPMVGNLNLSQVFYWLELSNIANSNLDFLPIGIDVDGNYLSLYNNPNLNDISRLSNNVSNVLFYQMHGNPQLSNCAIIPICNKLINNLCCVDVAGSNAVGCNTQSQILAQCLALPIDFVFLEIKVTPYHHTVMWTTEQEVNSEKQVVERSTDALTWVTIGQVESTNTPFKSHYEWVDSEPLPAAYYRIKNIDFDGKEQFSDIRFVRNTNLSEVNDLQIQLMGDMLTVNLPTSFESNTINLQIIDMMGRNIINENLFCNNEKVIDFQLNEFIANHGIYIARVTCDGRSHELKFVK